MAADFEGIIAALISMAQTTGKFENVAGAEFKNAPGPGATAALWFDGLDPLPEASGLSSTTMRFAMMMRIYLPSVVEPSDGIDPLVIAAAGAMFSALIAAFTLGGLIRNVDIFGEHGDRLHARPGWLPFGSDGGKYRTVDITIPMIVNDEYDQAA